MPGIDESRTFHPLRIAVLTVSDTRTEETDTSGGLLAERLDGGRPRAGREGDRRRRDRRRSAPRSGRGPPSGQVDIVLTTGGTGFAPRDLTPEAVKPLFRREMDGFAIVFHQASFGTVGTLHAPVARLRRARSGTPSSSACPARPAPAATAGTSSSASRSTAATAPARSPSRCRGSGIFSNEPPHPCRRGRPRPNGRRLGQGADRAHGHGGGPAHLPAATLAAVRAGTAPKGSVIATAELAGTMAAKRTADLIPLCHPLPLTKAAVTVEADESLPGFRVTRGSADGRRDRSRDGGPDRGLDRLPHLVRHAEGDRPDDGDRRRCG